MIETPMDVVRDFPVRKTRRQKTKFIEAVQSYAQRLNYQVRVEPELFGTRNVVIGDPEEADYIITAHYDTPAMLWCPNLMMPCNVALNALCQVLNFLILMLPALVVGGGVYCVTRDPATAYYSLLGAVVFSILMMIYGIPNPHNANYNTSGVVALLEVAASLPQNLRKRVCFVLFDREQVTMTGSAAYQYRHEPPLTFQIVMNLNSVGDGDTLVFFPSKDMEEDVHLLCLERDCGEKQVKIHKGGRFTYISDHSVFEQGIGVMALHKGKHGCWLKNTRTPRDKNLDYTNVNILRACLISYLSSHAAE